jgi:hypothetical protein
MGVIGEMSNQPNIINVQGLPEPLLRDLWKRLRDKKVEFICSKEQYLLIQSWESTRNDRA